MTDVTLLVMTDGRRDCLARSLPAAIDHLDGISNIVIHDDSGDASYRRWLRTQFPTVEFIGWDGGRRGFGGAIRNAWRHLQSTASPFVFHLEDDFVVRRHIALADLIAVLEARPSLVQLALRRQPWNDLERAAGGIVEQHPDAYEEATLGGASWLEHRLFFTTNPSLYRRSLCWHSWPEGGNSEGHFTHQLLEDPAVRFGFWGARDSGEWCEHIGHERVGTGY